MNTVLRGATALFSFILGSSMWNNPGAAAIFGILALLVICVPAAVDKDLQ